MLDQQKFMISCRLFYIDTCIWLNLFKKEGDASKGVPYWKSAKDFIENIMFSEGKYIIYSGFILKELKFRLGDENLFQEKLQFLKEEEKIRFAKAKEVDYFFARELESKFKYELSFFDCLHVALCKRLNLFLITRDAHLIRLAQNIIPMSKPERFNSLIY